ncbi:MAG TPA: discoidin domain-containing protein, partial [Paludibacter sp.]
STNSTDGELTYHWEQVSGPVQAAIESATLPVTEIKFNTEGVYVLRLGVSNGTETGSKDVTIKVAYPGSADDLAFRKKATASSSGVVTMYPQAAVDGNDNTRWASAQKNGEWWQVDLQHQVKPSQILMIWHNEYAKKYNIQISTNGSTWQTYATNDAFSGGTSTNTNTGDLSGRYIRVNCVERSGQWENSIKTFKLYGSFTTNTNQVPVARARYYKQVNYFMLDALESSDADNDGLTYAWSQITGPGFVTIENSTTSVARVSGLQPGSYFFKVTVDDGKDIDFKILHVVVEKEVPQAVSMVSEESGRIKIFPNPAKDQVSIKIADAGNAQIKIIDVNGREIFQQSYAGDNCIKLGVAGLLQRGVYFVKATRDNEVSVKKLIVN